jgi:hypothetical protein
MANIVIYGCYDSGTKEVVFQGEACFGGDYPACIMPSDDPTHPNMVAVTVYEAYQHCNGIYYGCFFPNTGEFQVLIPDDCCVSCPHPCTDYEMMNPSQWAVIPYVYIDGSYYYHHMIIENPSGYLCWESYFECITHPNLTSGWILGNSCTFGIEYTTVPMSSPNHAAWRAKQRCNSVETGWSQCWHTFTGPC